MFSVFRKSYPVFDLLLDEGCEHSPYNFKYGSVVVEIEALPSCWPGSLSINTC